MQIGDVIDGLHGLTQLLVFHSVPTINELRERDFLFLNVLNFNKNYHEHCLLYHVERNEM